VRRRRSICDKFLEVGVWVLVLGLLFPAALAGWAIGRTEKQKTRTVTISEQQAIEAERAAIQPAPAFSVDDLTAQPKDGWITNGGSLANERYSPLDAIDTGNVGQLKGVWHTHLRKAAIAAKYSAEGQPIVYKGTIYVPNGEDDVFAVSVKTGHILWEYRPHLDQTIKTVCCGWESRGVAIGDGRVYIGQLDAKLVALDQRTGKPVWTRQVGQWQKGQTITAAPLYYDGLVITGISGGEYSIRGRLTAFDAATGKEAWRFYTIPGPGAVGHDTWPSTGGAWQHGGASIWQTPAVDPDLGLLYFSTGNASPDLDGRQRAGDNLFTASIVALDAKTGKYRWHFQEVHHDIWDYDAPSPVVLFDATIGGKLRHGIGQAGKTGWFYLLDRATGKPLVPIPERSVPQLAVQKTARTQPIPSYPPFVPQTVSDASFKAIAKLVAASTKGQGPAPVKAQTMYAPFGRQPVIMQPGPQGGTNWPASSYNPDTHYAYVCGQAGASAYSLQAGPGVPQAKKGGPLDIGGALVITGFGQNVGTFTAVDVTSGKIAWQKRWPESCYAGSVTTGGGLVFVGRSTGNLLALDAETGKQLWSFQTGSGANDTATVFQQDGKEYLVFYAGGNALAASPHGDSLWLFGLDGTLGPAAPPKGGKGVGHAGEKGKSKTKGNAAAGRQVFADNCSTCHGALGRGGNGGPDLTTIPGAKNLTRVLAQVTNGGRGMPAFKGTLTSKQIQDVAAFVVEKITHGK
jgi:quinohemoprotein ethanol dehydrogenase